MPILLFIYKIWFPKSQFHKILKKGFFHAHKKLTYRIFFRVADFYPENMVQEPVNRLILIEHKYEFHNQSEVGRLKHFTWKDIPSQ